MAHAFGPSGIRIGLTYSQPTTYNRSEVQMLKEKNRSEDVRQREKALLPNTADPPGSDRGTAADTAFDALGLLIERAKEGDNDAFAALVEEYERFVYNTACRVLSASGMSIDTADDIAQDSFIKAWRNLSSFRGECSFSTWLFRITVNCARDAIRSSARRATVSLTRDDEDDEGEEWDVPLTSGDSIPEDALLKKEQILAVRRAIEALPEDQRQVIVMRDIHDLSYQTIADTLGLGLGTVKSRINRGRASLKALLESGKFL